MQFRVDSTALATLGGAPPSAVWHVLYAVQTWTRDAPINIAFDYVGDVALADPSLWLSDNGQPTCTYPYGLITAWPMPEVTIRGMFTIKTCGGNQYFRIELNSHPSVLWTTIVTQPGTLVRSTVTHELGHVLGLKHVKVYDSVMNSYDENNRRRDYRLGFQDAYAAIDVQGVRQQETDYRYFKTSPTTYVPGGSPPHLEPTWGASNGIDNRPTAGCEFHLAKYASVWADDTLAAGGPPPVEPDSQATWSSLGPIRVDGTSSTAPIRDFGTFRRPDAVYYTSEGEGAEEEGGEEGGGGPPERYHQLVVAMVQPWTNAIVTALHFPSHDEEAPCPDFFDPAREENWHEVTFEALLAWNGKQGPNEAWLAGTAAPMTTLDEPSIAYDPNSERILLAYTHESDECYPGMGALDFLVAGCETILDNDGTERSVFDGEILLAVGDPDYFRSVPLRLQSIPVINGPPVVTRPITTTGPAIACSPTEHAHLDFNCLLAYTSKDSIPRVRLRSFFVDAVGKVAWGPDIPSGYTSFDAPEITFDGTEFVLVFRPLSEDNFFHVSPTANRTGVIRAQLAPVTGDIVLAPGVVYVNNRMMFPPGIGSHAGSGSVEIFSNGL